MQTVLAQPSMYTNQFAHAQCAQAQKQILSGSNLNNITKYTIKARILQGNLQNGSFYVLKAC